MTERAQTPSSRLWLWLAIAAVVVAIDQITKVLVLQRFQFDEGVVVTSFFNVIRHHNPGAAFSFLAWADGWQRWLFTAFGAAASAFIVWMLRRHGSQTAFALALTLILGGAIGNVIDRVLYGYVVDFLQVHYGGWKFPTFNVADSAITLGAVLLIIDEFRRARA